MRLAIISDVHLGFEYNREMENDSYENFEEAIKKSMDCDLVILTGDLFEGRKPKTKAWAKALRLLSTLSLLPSRGVRLVSSDKELDKISSKPFRHLPVIALHGNHERKSKGEINAIKALENAGLLVYLHLNRLVVEKDGVKVAIHGMSSVPERFARDMLERWDPKPVENCFNLLLLHQNIAPYVYSPLEPQTLTLSNLPSGFDLIINGHVHTKAEEKVGKTIFLIPGSTVSTQFQPAEAALPKGFYKVEIGEEIKVSFVSLENARDFLCEDVKLDKHMPAIQQIELKLRSLIFKNFKRKPIVRLRIFGKDVRVSEQELRSVERKYRDRAIVIFSKFIEETELTKKIEFLRSLREQKLSVEEIGLSIFKRNLDELGFKEKFSYVDLFNLLSEGEIETAFKILIGEQKTLKAFYG